MFFLLDFQYCSYNNGAFIKIYIFNKMNGNVIVGL